MGQESAEILFPEMKICKFHAKDQAANFTGKPRPDSGLRINSLCRRSHCRLDHSYLHLAGRQRTQHMFIELHRADGQLEVLFRPKHTLRR